LQALAAALHQPDVDAGIALAVDRKQRCEQRPAANGQQPEPERAALEAAQFAELGDQVVPLREDPLCPPVGDLARGRQLAAMADAIEQRHVCLPIGRPTATQLRAKRAALLAFAAPTLFTFVGVVLSK
jgi:hypothetical protein